MAKKYKSGVEPGGILHRPAGIEHPEKKNIEPKPRGAYPTGHTTTRVVNGATSAPPKAKKESKSLVDRQIGGNSDPKKRAASTWGAK